MRRITMTVYRGVVYGLPVSLVLWTLLLAGCAALTAPSERSEYARHYISAAGTNVLCPKTVRCEVVPR